MCDDDCDLTPWNYKATKWMPRNMDVTDISMAAVLAVALAIFIFIVGFLAGVVVGEGRAYKTIVEQQHANSVETASDAFVK